MSSETQKRIIDYYIFIDYSFDLIGYNIIQKEKIPQILPKIAKFRHHKEERHKKIYLHKIKREIKNSNLTSLILKQKIMQIKDNSREIRHRQSQTGGLLAPFGRSVGFLRIQIFL